MKDLGNKTGKTDDQFRRDAEVKLGIPLFPDVSWNLADDPKFDSTKRESELIHETERPQHDSETLSDCSSRYFDRKKIAGV